MNIKTVINNYVECNEFEMRIINGKLKVYYHDKIEHFSDDKIVVSSNNKKYVIEGKNLIIEKMFEEVIVISGKINKIIMGNYDE